MAHPEPSDLPHPHADAGGAQSALDHRTPADNGVSSRTAPDHARGARRHLWIFLAFAAIGGLFLLTEHRAHALGLLPYLLLVACPLMHLLMHRNHGKHGRHGGRQ